MATRRRGRSEGSIYKQPGCRTWTIKFSDHGKTVREASGKRDYAAAQQLLIKRLREVDTSTFVEPEVRRILVSELVEDFFRDYRVNLRKSLDDATARWKLHLEPFFGAMRAADVTSSVINKYVDRRLDEGAANATVNRELAVLKKMFRLAYYKACPAKVTRVPGFPRLKESKPRSGFLENEQYDRLTAAVTELWQRALIEVAHTYGWRKQELLDLRARQVDLLARTIRLDPGETKNGEGREVTMTDMVHALLTECVRGKSGGDDFVFTRSNGRPVRDFRKSWADLCIKAGLGLMRCRKCEKPVTGEKCETCGASGRGLKYSGLILHDTRRSAARNLRRAGVGEETIMRIGGWLTPSVFKRYSIVSQTDVTEALQKLEKRRDEDVRAMKKAAQGELGLSHDSVMISGFGASRAPRAARGKAN
jgi:integrase